MTKMWTLALELNCSNTFVLWIFRAVPGRQFFQVPLLNDVELYFMAEPATI